MWISLFRIFKGPIDSHPDFQTYNHMSMFGRRNVIYEEMNFLHSELKLKQMWIFIFLDTIEMMSKGLDVMFLFIWSPLKGKLTTGMIPFYGHTSPSFDEKKLLPERDREKYRGG